MTDSTVFLCSDLVGQGYRPDAVDAIASAGRCVWNPENLPQVSPVAPVTTTAQSLPITAQLPTQSAGGTDASLGAFFLIVMGTAGVIAAIRWRNRRDALAYLPASTRPVHLLPSMSVVDVVTRPSNASNTILSNTHSTGIRGHSYENLAPEHKSTLEPSLEGYSSEYTEPNPFAMPPSMSDTYRDDRTGSNVTVGTLYDELKTCTNAEFCKRVPSSDFDPVDIMQTGNGAIQCKRVAFEWLGYGINQVGKLGHVLFNTDCQGKSARVTAARRLIDEYQAEWHRVNFGGRN